MVLDKLSESLKGTLSKIARAMFVDEKLIDELVKDIQRALLGADVNVKLVFELTKSIKERALKEKPPAGLSQREYIVKVVYEELVKFLGGEGHKIEIKKKPFRIMMVGLLGVGKTTTIGKLAKYYSKRSLKVAVLGLDVYRPAAMDQLEQLARQQNIVSFINKKEKDPVKIYKSFEKELNEFDLIIIDTAGRHALDTELIKEIETLNEVIKPEERLLVIAADLGQAAQKQAEQFHKSCNITGVIATKMEGTAKAGGALTACAAASSPMVFIGVGEKVDDLEPFNPTGFVSRLLGMGDLELLLEKAKEAMTEEKAEDLKEKLVKGEFNFIDLYEQMESMSKMGSLSKLIDLIPGMGNVKIPKEMLAGQEEKLKKWRFILQSCTKKELEDPEVLDSNRIERIAKGSGTTVQEVRELLKQYRQSKKLMKMMKGDAPEKMFKKLQGKMGKR
ncbi:MAG: signal recognition particle protein Srp54 [Candidatus Nanoarchaeia archaeon]